MHRKILPAGPFLLQPLHHLLHRRRVIHIHAVLAGHLRIPGSAVDRRQLLAELAVLLRRVLPDALVKLFIIRIPEQVHAHVHAVGRILAGDRFQVCLGRHGIVSLLPASAVQQHGQPGALHLGIVPERQGHTVGVIRGNQPVAQRIQKLLAGIKPQLHPFQGGAFPGDPALHSLRHGKGGIPHVAGNLKRARLAVPDIVLHVVPAGPVQIEPVPLLIHGAVDIRIRAGVQAVPAGNHLQGAILPPPHGNRSGVALPGPHNPVHYPRLFISPLLELGNVRTKRQPVLVDKPLAHPVLNTDAYPSIEHAVVIPFPQHFYLRLRAFAPRLLGVGVVGLFLRAVHGAWFIGVIPFGKLLLHRLLFRGDAAAQGGVQFRLRLGPLHGQRDEVSLLVPVQSIARIQHHRQSLTHRQGKHALFLRLAHHLAQLHAGLESPQELHQVIQQLPQPGGKGRMIQGIRQPAGTPDLGKRLNRIVSRYGLACVQVDELHVLPPRLREQIIDGLLRILEHHAELSPGRVLLRLPGDDGLFHRFLHQILHRRASAGVPQHPAEGIPPADVGHIRTGKRRIHGRNLELRVAGLFRPDALLGLVPRLDKGAQRNMLAQRSIHAGGGFLIAHPLRLQGADGGHRHIRAGLHLPQGFRGNHHPFRSGLFICLRARDHLGRIKPLLGKRLVHRHVPGQHVLRVKDVILHLLAHKRLQVGRHLLAVHQRVGGLIAFLLLTSGGSGILPLRFRTDLLRAGSIYPEHAVLLRRFHPRHHSRRLGCPPRIQFPQGFDALPGKAFPRSHAGPLHGPLGILHPGIMQIGKSLVQKPFGGLFLPGFQVSLCRSPQGLVILQGKLELLGGPAQLGIIQSGQPKAERQEGKSLFSGSRLGKLTGVLIQRLLAALVVQQGIDGRPH